MTYRTIKLALLATVGLVLGANVADAAPNCPAGYPNKPIRFVVGFGAGGGTDVIGRAIASGLEQQFKWTVVVENKPGSGGGVMSSWLKTQAPDGYTIGINGTDAVTVNPAQTDVGYAWDDFEYLGSGMQTWTGLVALKDAPFNDIKTLVEYAKKNGRATISVAGVNQEVLVKQLAEQFKVNLVPVPGTGAAEAMAAALGGHVDATTQGTLHVAQIKSGKMKQIASVIGRRVPYAPDNGTMAEQGATAAPLDAHTMAYTPKGIPANIKTCLKEAIDEVVKSPQYKVLMDKFENEAVNLGENGLKELLGKAAAFYKEALKK
jgi:tripartite-type tricarboxylate transporter receptor subunit TctC